MQTRVKAVFTFDIYVNGEYSNEVSYTKGDAMTFKQAIAEAKKQIRNFSANHVKIFLTAGSLAVADVTMFNREITVNDYDQDYTPAPTTDTPANESEATKQTEKAVISLPKYYTETPERLRLLARSMADQYKGLNDPEAKRMKALYLDIAGAPEYFLKNNLIKAI